MSRDCSPVHPHCLWEVPVRADPEQCCTVSGMQKETHRAESGIRSFPQNKYIITHLRKLAEVDKLRAQLQRTVIPDHDTGLSRVAQEQNTSPSRLSCKGELPLHSELSRIFSDRIPEDAEGNVFKCVCLSVNGPLVSGLGSQLLGSHTARLSPEGRAMYSGEQGQSPVEGGGRGPSTVRSGAWGLVQGPVQWGQLVHLLRSCNVSC